MKKEMKVFIIYSGKGGVGKTTTTANIARILAAKGKKVFILDADVNTPSIPVIFPNAAHSARIHCASIGYKTKKAIYLTDSAIRSYISECINEINDFGPEYVLIDTPPSITDVHIGLLDKINPSGLLIVTQPNELSMTDVNRTAMFFKQRNVPILGIVENMCLAGKAAKTEYTWKLLGSIPFSQDFNNKTVFNANKEVYNKIADSFVNSASVILENKTRALFDETVTVDDIRELPFNGPRDLKFINLQTWEFVRDLLMEIDSVDMFLVENDSKRLGRMIEPFRTDSEAHFMITKSPGCSIKLLPGEIGKATLITEKSYYGVPRLRYQTQQGEITVFAHECMPVDNNYILQALGEGYVATQDGRYLPSKRDMEEVFNAFGSRVGMLEDWEEIYDKTLAGTLPRIDNGTNTTTAEANSIKTRGGRGKRTRAIKDFEYSISNNPYK